MIFLQDLSKLQIKAIKESLKGFFVANLCHVSSLYFTERRPFESGTTESLLGMETLTEELMGKKFQVLEVLYTNSTWGDFDKFKMLQGQKGQNFVKKKVFLQ